METGNKKSGKSWRKERERKKTKLHEDDSDHENNIKPNIESLREQLSSVSIKEENNISTKPKIKVLSKKLAIDEHLNGSVTNTTESKPGSESSKMVESSETPTTEAVPKQDEHKNENRLPETCNVTSEEPQSNTNNEEEIEKAQQLEEDRLFLEAYIADATKRLAKKAELRSANLTVAKDRPEFSTVKLDSSLKKNTAFIKKLRNFTESQFAALSKELSGLNLSRYVGEAASAILDARLKMADIPYCVELCSSIHQRYADFAPALLAGCTKLIKEKPDEKITNLSKLRVDLRLFAELIAVGIFSPKEGLPVLGSVITNLVVPDKNDHRNVSVIVSFCKFCGEDFMGTLPTKIEALSKTFNMEVPRSDFLPAERQKNVRQLMKDYYSSLCDHVIRQHKLIQREEQRNRRLLETRGEVDEARLTAIANEASVLEKLLQQAASMAEYLQETVPELPKEKKNEDEGGLVLGEDGNMTSFSGTAEVGDIWEDEESRTFYTCLPQLKALLPSILYSESERALAEGNKEEVKDEETEEETIDPNQMAEKEEEDDLQDCDEDDKDGSSSVTKASQKLVFAGFLNSLSNCISRDLMDAAALEFCLTFNTKPLRKKLARSLYLVPRNRIDLLPFYARLVASLEPLMPDLPQDLLSRLRMDFRYQVKKKDQTNLETKLKICRFLAELTKFSVFSGTDCLNCLKMLLNDFRHHHIEMTCTILENAGRFLYRSPSTHHLTKVLLDQMMRKKSLLSYEARYTTMIENAYYYVNPPESTQLMIVEPLTPLEQFIKHLIADKLCKVSIEKILKLIRKLDWCDNKTADFCINCLIASWNVKFYNIRYLASLVSGLVPYYEWIGQAVVDGVLEDIRVGLETNMPSLNQRRVSSCKYLAELYNYRVMESNVIFKVLYSLITFGAGIEQDLDPPEHLLRLRLVITLLDTCGQFFSSGLSMKKLDCFIVYFQHYFLYKKAYWTASDCFPVEYDQMVLDSLAKLRPDLKFYEDINEAMEAVNALNQQLLNKALQQAPELRNLFPQEEGSLSTIKEKEEDEESVNEEEDFVDDEDEEDMRYENEFSESQEEDTAGLTSGKDDGTQTGDSTGSESQDDSDDKTAAATNMTVHTIKCEEDDDFMSAFERMMSDTLLEHSREAKPTPAPLPLATKTMLKKTYDQLIGEQQQNKEEDCSSVDANQPSAPNVVKFVLMSRGVKTQQGAITTISVPENSEMVAKMRDREKQEAEERRNVKRVTLEMTERQEEEEIAMEILQQRNAAQGSIGNLNRERRNKYQHPKGAPDADLIFGNKTKAPMSPSHSGNR